MRRSLPPNVCGERVRVAILEARPAGLSTNDLVAATELTTSQVRKGIVFVKDLAAAEHLTPLTWNRREGYRFSEDPNDWIAYETAQFHTLLTRLTRLITGTVDPHHAVRPDDEQVGLVRDQLNGVRAALQVLTRAGG